MAIVSESPGLDWANSRSSPKEALRLLGYFTKHCGFTPRQLLDMQTEARKSEDPDAEFVVIDLVKKWIASVKGRKGTKLTYVSTVRSFFDFHHRPLPEDRTWIRGLKSDRGRVEGKVNMEVLTTILNACRGDPRKRSMMLVQLQSFSGPREVCIIGNTMGPHIADELKKGSNLIDLYFDTGRKHSDKGWHTYIGKDACDALREWFLVRGYPTANDPYIWPSEKPQTKGAPSTVGAVQQNFARLAGRLGFRPRYVRRTKGKQIPPIGESHSRYGVSVKELRDLSLSLAQQAVGKEDDLGERFQESSAEYFAGHTIDDLGYRKLHQLDPDYRKRQYEIVEPFLSPLSSPNGALKSRVEELEGQMAEMVADIASFETEELGKIWAAKTREERQAIRERLFGKK